jgi:hypothetical protein
MRRDLLHRAAEFGAINAMQVASAIESCVVHDERERPDAIAFWLDELRTNRPDLFERKR